MESVVVSLTAVQIKNVEVEECPADVVQMNYVGIEEKV